MKLRHIAFRSAAAVTVAAIIGAASAGSTSAAPATNPIVVDFSTGYTAGLPNAQQGWYLATGSRASGNQPYDFKIADLANYTEAALPDTGLSLRISNATVSPVFNAGLISPKLATGQAAGEPGSGASLNTFTANYTIASSTGGYQDGLNVEVSVGNDYDRSGGVLLFRHVNGGLEIGTQWVPSDATGVGTYDDWRTARIAGPLAGGLWDPTVAHHITTVLHFVVDGPDLIELTIDGTMIGTLPNWEYYHALATPLTPKKTAANLMFRATVSTITSNGIGFDVTVPAAPATLDEGFLFADISYGSSNIDGWAPTKPTTPVLAATDETQLAAGADFEPEVLSEQSATGTRTLDLGTEYANQYVAVYIYSTPTFLGWFLADGTGVVTFSVPASVPSGTHTIAVYDATGSLSGWVANVVVSALVAPAALAATGVEPVSLTIAALALLTLGGVLAITRRRWHAGVTRR